MPFYHRAGELPPTKHTTFYRGDSGVLHREELFSSKGFSGAYANRYHLELPTAIRASKPYALDTSPRWRDAPVLPMHVDTNGVARDGDFIRGRTVLFENAHVRVATARVTRDTPELYRNGGAWEYVFVHRGEGVFESEFGEIPFGPGDQLVIPRAVTWRLSFARFDDVRLLVVESPQAIEIPRAYRNDVGQITEEAPYDERAIRVPVLKAPRIDRDVRLILKLGDRSFDQILQHHPFDLVGWDGALFPFALNLRDFRPKVGQIHLPPPVHLVFRSERFVICNFVPRPFDFHPKAIPAPYFHSNIESDELLYYCGGDFMSRAGVREGSITLHPGGMPHGPQPGRTEASIGVEETEEWAVMLDTFDALHPSEAARAINDETYYRSWVVDGEAA